MYVHVWYFLASMQVYILARSTMTPFASINTYILFIECVRVGMWKYTLLGVRMHEGCKSCIRIFYVDVRWVRTIRAGVGDPTTRKRLSAMFVIPSPDSVQDSFIESSPSKLQAKMVLSPNHIHLFHFSLGVLTIIIASFGHCRRSLPRTNQDLTESESASLLRVISPQDFLPVTDQNTA